MSIMDYLFNRDINFNIDEEEDILEFQELDDIENTEIYPQVYLGNGNNNVIEKILQDEIRLVDSEYLGENGRVMSEDEFMREYKKLITLETGNYIEEYYRKVVTGEYVVGIKVFKTVVKIYNDYKRSINDENCPFYYDNDIALNVINYIQNIPNVKNSKGQLIKVRLMTYQKFILSAFFGFIMKETGYRKFRRIYLQVARKNGKSFLSALIAIYVLYQEVEVGRDTVSLASTERQSKIIYRMITDMIKLTEELKIGVNVNKEVTEFKDSEGYVTSNLVYANSNSKAFDGNEFKMTLIDEVHAITDKDTVDTLVDATIISDQPVIIYTTTAGTYYSEFYERIYDTMNKIIESYKDGADYDDIPYGDTILPMIYQLDYEEEWKDENKWSKANPSIHEFKNMYNNLKIEMDALRPHEDDDEKTKVTKRYELRNKLIKHFNIRKNDGQAWLEFDEVNNGLKYSEDILDKGYVKNVIVGIDMSQGSGDLTAVSLLYKFNGHEEFFVKQFYFMLRNVVESKTRSEGAPYDIWAENGDIILIDSLILTSDIVIDWVINYLNERGITAVAVGYDRYNVNQLQAETFIVENNTDENLVRYVMQNGKTLSQPIQVLESLILGNKLNYNDNPILKWNLLNVELITDREGYVLPAKKTTINSKSYKIDGASSLLDAFSIYLEYKYLMDDYFEAYNIIEQERYDEYVWQNKRQL